MIPSGFLDGSVFKDVLYHGSSTSSIERLLPDARSGEYGIYLTPRFKMARAYGDNVYRVLVNIQNPLFVADKSELAPRGVTKAIARRLASEGYDALVSSPTDDIADAYEVVVFDPSSVHVLRTNPEGSTMKKQQREYVKAREQADHVWLSAMNEESTSKKAKLFAKAAKLFDDLAVLAEGLDDGAYHAERHREKAESCRERAVPRQNPSFPTRSEGAVFMFDSYASLLEKDDAGFDDNETFVYRRWVDGKFVVDESDLEEFASATIQLGNDYDEVLAKERALSKEERADYRSARDALYAISSKAYKRLRGQG